MNGMHHYQIKENNAEFQENEIKKIKKLIDEAEEQAIQ